MDWFEILKYVGSGAFGSMLTAVVLLTRERNNFATKTMDLFIADKKAWTTERAQLEQRIDYLYEKVDGLHEKLIIVAAYSPPAVATQVTQ